MIPESNKQRLQFKYTYIKNPYRNKYKNIHMQLDTNSFAYFESYSAPNDVGIKFSLEQFNSAGKLQYKLISDYVKWDTTKNLWSIQNYYERTIHNDKEIIRKGLLKDPVLNMKPEEFRRRNADVEMLDYFELSKEIEKEKFKGSRKVVNFQIEKHKRIAFPFAAIILTLIGVAIASRKVRGGIGMHLGLGLLISFSYIMFMKITQTFSTNGGLHPMMAMWIPNIIYGVLAIILLKKAPK
jgi:lipopolysaccharide export system permease protein